MSSSSAPQTLSLSDLQSLELSPDTSLALPLRSSDLLLVGAKSQAESVAVYTFHVCYKNIQIPMRDGIRLRGDLYMPAMDGKPEEGQARSKSNTFSIFATNEHVGTWETK